MEKNSLLTFFEVLSSKIKCWVSPKNKISTLGLHVPNLFFFSPRLQNSTLRKRYFLNRSVLLFLLISFFGFTTAVAQNLPPASSCTSGDLILLDATLPPNAGEDVCGNCTTGSTTAITRTLYLSINNKTGSLRTSFRFWGTLKIYNADGTLKIATPAITMCGGPIQPSIINKIAVGEISYLCGERIELTDLFLAWSTSNKKEDCAWMLVNSATISPKCGTSPPINVFTGLDAVFTTTQIKCNGGGGTIASNVGGGKAPYTVSWKKDGAPYPAGSATLIMAPFTQTLSNLGGGSYTLTITDANGCVKTKTAVVINPEPAALALGTCIKTDVTCAGGDGTATTSFSNAVLPVSYSWKNVATGVTVSSAVTAGNLSAGDYTFTVTDACFTRTCSVTVAPPTPITTPAATLSQPTCGVATGMVTITPAIYSSAITYTLTQSGSTVYTAANGVFSSVAPGTYGLKASQGICSKTGTDLIVNQQPATPNAPTVTVVNNCDGSSDLTASDYTGSLLWSNGATGASIHVTNATTYTVTQTSADGCTSLSGSGTSAPKATPSAPTVTVVNNCDGSSDLTASDYTGTLLWSNGAATASIHVTNAATYTVTQTAINGCTSLAGSGTSAPKATPSAPTVTVVNNCDGSSDLTASNYTGSLLWSNAATTASIHVTNAATYTVTQTATNGCTSLAGSGTSAPKTTPSAPTVTVVNNCDGSSDLTASNYTGSLLWSTGAATASIHVTNAATYTVTQTATNGCTSLAGSGTSAPKTTPSAPTVTVVNNCDGSSDLTASNYTGSLLWSTGAATASIHVTNAATYTVTQTATNGCTSL
ncbi:hypothetical protein ACM55K_17365, partial [Flavobacterium sp. LT1R49]|uniref:hypothetical protein n=1 Tax=Flavobacterium arabinosi TaxID=3398737 RepID=UPI003A854B45